MRTLFTTLALAGVTVLGCDYESPGALREQKVELDQDDVVYYSALRRDAFQEMYRMPPRELRVFMMENKWEERWPELWGPGGAHAAAERAAVRWGAENPGQSPPRFLTFPPPPRYYSEEQHDSIDAEILREPSALNGRMPDVSAPSLAEIAQDIGDRRRRALPLFLERHAERWAPGDIEW